MMGIGLLDAVQEEEGSLEEMRKSLFLQREKIRKQSKVVQSWKNKFRDENRLVTKLKREKEEYLQSIESQLLLFESHLRKSRGELERLINYKDETIRKQHQIICCLTLALIKREGHEDIKKIFPGLRLETSSPEFSKKLIDDSLVSRNNLKNSDSELDEKKQPNLISYSKNELECLNDSDSAIMMEDTYDSLIAMPAEKGEIKVMRSVSDALEIISRGVSSSFHNSKSILGNHVRKPLKMSTMSSTASFSSEESDESPSSTISKNYSMNSLKERKHDGDHLNFNKMSTNYPPLLTSTPSAIYSFLHPSESLQSENCCMSSSTSCSQCDSTTPLASPSQTPSSSPPTSLLRSPPSYSSPTQITFDFDSDATLSDGQSEEGDSNPDDSFSRVDTSNSDETPSSYSFYNKVHDVDVSYLRRPHRDELIQVTYNRVMSNHRSVTKPKDVKYKRINKAKSRSLEELRGKLKSFDGRQAFSVDLEDQSDA